MIGEISASIKMNQPIEAQCNSIHSPPEGRTMFANTFTMEGVGAGAVPLRFVICACQRNIPRVSALQSFYADCFAHMTLRSIDFIRGPTSPSAPRPTTSVSKELP